MVRISTLAIIINIIYTIVWASGLNAVIESQSFVTYMVYSIHILLVIDYSTTNTIVIVAVKL